MRSDTKHLAKCGKESAYFCRMKGDMLCGKAHSNCKYKPHTTTSRAKHNDVHPIASELSTLYIQAIRAGLPNTAWCIDLAMTAFGWEIQPEDYHSQPVSEDMRDMIVMNKLKAKIEEDKGVRII